MCVCMQIWLGVLCLDVCVFDARGVHLYDCGIMELRVCTFFALECFRVLIGCVFGVRIFVCLCACVCMCACV